MHKKLGFLILFLISMLSVKSESIVFKQTTLTNDSVKIDSESKQWQPKRGTAIAFTLLTGPLGGHRVYLTSKPTVPIIYTVTLGGFGILPVVDLFHLIFSKDIKRYKNSPQIVMWGRKTATQQ